MSVKNYLTLVENIDGLDGTFNSDTLFILGFDSSSGNLVLEGFGPLQEVTQNTGVVTTSNNIFHNFSNPFLNNQGSNIIENETIVRTENNQTIRPRFSNSIQPFNMGQFIPNNSTVSTQKFHSSMENIYRISDENITDKFFAVLYGPSKLPPMFWKVTTIITE